MVLVLDTSVLAESLVGSAVGAAVAEQLGPMRVICIFLISL